MSWPYSEQHRVFVRYADGPLNEIRYREVGIARDVHEAYVVKNALEAVGAQVVVQNDPRPPHSGR